MKSTHIGVSAIFLGSTNNALHICPNPLTNNGVHIGGAE